MVEARIPRLQSCGVSTVPPLGSHDDITTAFHVYVRKVVIMKIKMCERKTSIVVNGRRYKTIKSACKAYHTPYSIYNLRLSRGWDRIDAIVTPVQQGKQCVDHLGNHYDSVTHMCEAYGIDRNTFYRKKRKNIPIEKILMPEHY